MTPDQLAAAGRSLYGERWQTSLAADLQIADRTMRRWLADEKPIPGSVDKEVREVLVQRVKEISQLIGYWVNPSDRSVFHYPTNAAFRYDDAGNLILVHPGMAAWEAVAALTEGAKEALTLERARDQETAKRFVRASAYWLTHSSGKAVRAPGHADRVYMSQHGWTVEFGANSFLVGKAIKRCREVLERCRLEAEAGQALSRSDVEAKLKKVISGCVANSTGEEYSGYYPIRHDDTLVFGAQGIGVDDGANFMIGESNLEWDGEFLATPKPSSATSEVRGIEGLPFDPAFLTRVAELEFGVRTANCLKNDNIVYVGDLVQKTEAELLRTSDFGRKSLNEVKEVLAQMDFHLGMEVTGWPPGDIEGLAKAYGASMHP